jgi:GNAT superfamily N-acetyltransferase
VHIRRAHQVDIPALLPLVAEYWEFEGLAGFDGARLGTQLERLLDDPSRGIVLLAYRDRGSGGPVGYLIMVYVFSLEHAGLTAEVDEFFVQPSSRGGGAGTQLLAEAEVECRRNGCTNISLQLGRGNAKARAFYRGKGYVSRAGYELLEKSLDDA